MPQHFVDDREPVDFRRKLIIVATVVLLLVSVGVAVAVLLGGDWRDVANGVSEDAQRVAMDSPAVGETADGAATNSFLPFSLDGAPLDADLVEAVEIAQPTELAGEWTFGGDYAQIGSFPLDGQTVFGSATDNPNDLSSYRAALITPDGVTYLEEVKTEGRVFEPQDGTGTFERLVWRSAEITLLPSSGLDNWRVQTWDSTSGETVVLGSAELLNAASDTPSVGGEVVPVCSDSHALFSSCVREGEEWSPAIVSFDLTKTSQKGEIIGSGNYPAVVGDDVLWATNLLGNGDGTLYSALNRWNGSKSAEVFSISSEGEAWGISGVWARGGHVAVCFSPVSADTGCYVGVWNEDFSSCETIIHAPSSSVVASLNNRWFVWGSGSQALNTGMYALEISSEKVLDLGSTIGYSRPCVAAEGDAVIVPRENGSDAVVFSVGELQV